MKIFRSISILLIVLLLLPMTALAAGEIAMDQPATLTVQVIYGDTPVTGMVLEAYRVATIDAQGELTVEPAFSQYGDQLDIRGENDTAWLRMAGILEGEIREKEITPTATATVDGAGTANFGTLPKGLYLIRGDAMKLGQSWYAISPFFVQLPQRAQGDWNTWVYSVTANAKPSTVTEISIRVEKRWVDNCKPSHSHPAVTMILYRDGVYFDQVTLPVNGRYAYTWEHLDPGASWMVKEVPVDGYTAAPPVQEGNTFLFVNTCTKTPAKPTLPQTGQLWWPVPVLLLAGLALVVIGLARRRGGRDEE